MSERCHTSTIGNAVDTRDREVALDHQNQTRVSDHANSEDGDGGTISDRVKHFARTRKSWRVTQG